MSEGTPKYRVGDRVTIEATISYVYEGQFGDTCYALSENGSCWEESQLARLETGAERDRLREENQRLQQRVAELEAELELANEPEVRVTHNFPIT